MLKPIRLDSSKRMDGDCLGVGWLPQVSIDLVYCHEGRKIADLSRFEWHGHQIVAAAIREAIRGCERYAITSDSTMQLIAFQTEREVPRVRTGEPAHWQRADDSHPLLEPVIVSRYPIWSSRQGAMAPQLEWDRHTLTFTKIVRLCGPGLAERDLCNFFSVQLAEISPKAMLGGFAVADGRLEHLMIDVLEAGQNDEGTRCLRITGSVVVAVDPQLHPLSSAVVIQLADQHLDLVISSRPPYSYGESGCSAPKIVWSPTLI